MKENIHKMILDRDVEISKLKDKLLALNTENERLKAAMLKAIDDEPEYVGDCPDELWNAINGNKDATSEALRLTVRYTKGGIKERFLAVIKQTEGGENEPKSR